ncbi:MAG: hypothetical protein M1825_001976 [Sarcosagium campestre]|nr:MAG: hypothetical protein M1825_001976 [Sarcosagium campestre]
MSTPVMSPSKLVARTYWGSRQLSHRHPNPLRAFFTTPVVHDTESLDTTASSSTDLAGTKLIGSRRRRAAISEQGSLAFEELPYQCFQEARKVLRDDREEKLRLIAIERARIAKVQAKLAESSPNQRELRDRLVGMKRHLETLKVLADVNDPVVKKRFEDGLGDMNRPVYRYLADKKWRSYRRLVLLQRISQMAIVPDLLPHLDPVVDVKLAFRGRKVPPGDFVQSIVSEYPPTLQVQVFDKGERMFTIAVVDSDVPNVENDSFDSRCHFLASNVPLSPTSASVPLSRLSAHTQTILPWLPPYAQKGSPYHRLAIIVLRQPEGSPLDVAATRERVQRDGFKLRGFITKHYLRPVGAHLFRTQFDEGTPGVMDRAHVPGADVELRREKVEPLHPKPLPLKLKRNRLGLAGLPSKRT